MKRMISKQMALFFTILLLLTNFTYIGQETVQAAVLDQAVTITAVDDKGEAVIKTTAISFNDGATAEDILEQVAAENEIDIEKSGSDFGNYLIGIDGNTAGEGSYWGFIVNGVDAAVGMSEYEVSNSENILFVLSEANYLIPEVTVNVSVIGRTCDVLVDNEEIRLRKNSTAYDALMQAAESVDASVDSDYFTYVNNINSYDLVDGDFWSFIVNHKESSTGLIGKTAEANDVYEFRLDNYLDGSLIDENCTDDFAGKDTDEESEEKEAEVFVTKNIEALIDEIENDINSLANYFLATNSVNAYGDEWAVWGLASLGVTIPNSYQESLRQLVAENKGDFGSVTELEKVIISLATSGVDVTDFAGVNLLRVLEDNTTLTTSISAAVYGLIAFNSADFPVNEAVEALLIDYILEAELVDGGWTYFGDQPSVDITGMVLTSLAPYKNQAEVSEAIERAVVYLSAAQDDSGGYYKSFNGGYTSESAAQVIIGLTAVGVDPTSIEFTKAEGNLVEFFLQFKTDTGLYKHKLEDVEANDMANQQGLLALAYLNDFANLGVIVNVEVEKEEEAEEVPVQGEQENIEDGNRLPDTATQIYNLIAFGLLFIVSGMVYLIYHRRKQAV